MVIESTAAKITKMFWKPNLVTLVTTVTYIFLAKEASSRGVPVLVSVPSYIGDSDKRKISCFEGVELYHSKKNFSRWLRSSALSYNELDQTDTNICEFAFNYFDLFTRTMFSDYYFNPGNLSISWHCKITDNVRCNNYSTCLTDECLCSDSPVFYCKDNSGCISFANVCDGRQDCLDGSDECMCEGRIRFICPSIKPETTICLTTTLFCHGDLNVANSLLKSENCYLSHPTVTLNCTHVMQEYVEVKKKLSDSPLFVCLFDAYETFFLQFNRRDLYDVANYCKENCTREAEFVKGNWVQYCNHIFLGETSPLEESFYWSYVFNCEQRPYMEEMTDIIEVCDGKKDCDNGADEKGCPGRFYCSPNSSIDWVSSEQLCDNVKDCPNGQDECGTCDMGPLSSSDYLIHSKIVLYLTGFAGLLMVVLNVAVGIECFKSEPSNKPGIIDRILRLQVIFYDGLMGIYNIMIVVAAIVLKSKGPYCLSDQSWRSSLYCSALGILFSVSSHGSLMVIGFMSIVRCLTCTQTLVEIRKSAVLILSAVLLLVNLVNSFIPVLPFSEVQDIFRSQAFFLNFKDNPFISSGLVNLTRLNQLHNLYYATTTTFYKTIENLNNVTSEEGLFDVIEIGYYGNTRMCTQNIFKSQDSYLIYKLVYLIVISVIVIAVAFTYLIILYKKIQSHRHLKSMGAPQNPGQQDEISLMKTKIFLMIGSQLLCWMSYVIAAAYYQFSKSNPPIMTFEIFSLVVLPINSILNPIFYSGIYKNIQAFFSRAWKLLAKKLGHCCLSEESTNQNPITHEVEMQETKK